MRRRVRDSGRGNLAEVDVKVAGLLWGFCILYAGNQCLGPSDLSADLTIVQNDKCIDSCGACFAVTLTVSMPL